MTKLTGGEEGIFPAPPIEDTPIETAQAAEAEDALYLAAPLTADELAKIREEARKAILDEQHKVLFEKALAEEKEKARDRAGIAAGSKERRVRVYISLPDSVAPVGALVINGRCYWDGASYDVPESLARTMNSMQFEAWKNEGRQNGRWTDLKTRKPKAINMQTGEIRGIMPVAIGRTFDDIDLDEAA
jgi:hypothetical protein